MLVTKKPYIRVIPGPDPNQYGIIAKPYRPYVENINERRQRIEEKSEKILSDDKKLKSELLKINFFEDANKKAKLKSLKRTVDEIMNQRNFHLTERRNRLKQLLYNDEQQYEREIETSIETPLERASRLREKAKKIRDEKELEKKQFIEEKLDQKWRNESDDLRRLKSKYLQSEMRVEHLRQMEENACKERQRMDDESYYAELWHNDMLAKKEREDKEAKIVAQRNMETSSVLKEQMQVLEKQKEEEKRLRIENARLAHERVSIEKIEKQLAYQNKLRIQDARKNELDTNLRIKMRRQQKLAQEELALDLKLLEEALASYEGEEKDRALRKRELHEEGKRYREYLRALNEEEKRQEAELDKVIDAEVERLFKKRLSQWQAEREARKKLLEDVMAERKQQVDDKIRRNEERQRQLEIEKKEINENIERCKQLEKQDQYHLFAKNKAYENDLLSQMEYNLQNKEKERYFDYLEYQSCLKADDDYQKRLENNIKNLKIDRLHPIRKWSSPSYEVGSGCCNRCKLAIFAQPTSNAVPKSAEQFCKCPIVYY